MKTLSCVLVSVAIAGLAPAQAPQSLIIPKTVDVNTEGRVNTQYPFGYDGFSPLGASSRVQYVYDNSHFDGVTTPILIESLEFRADDATPNFSGTGGTWNNAIIRLSSSGLPYDQIGNTFAGNFPGGVEPAPVFSGSVTVTPWSGNYNGLTGDWNVLVILDTPFLFDPRTGDDFILDIANSGLFFGQGSNLWTMDEDFDEVQCNRLRNNVDWTGTDGTIPNSEYGIVCRLGYSLADGLHANFRVDTRTPGPLQLVQFSCESYSSDPGGIVAWLWDFNGDGIDDSTDENPTWLFTSCGNHPVSLTVLDGMGLDTHTVTSYIQVGPPEPSFDVDWSHSFPVLAQFTDTSNGNPTQWEWDFDADGVADSTDQNPVWSFPGLGSYPVTLTTTNTCGSQTVTETVDMLPIVGPGVINNSFNGVTGFTHYFDVNVSNPQGITVTDLGFNSNQPFNTFVSINVYTTPNTWVGVDANQSAWTLLGSFSAQSRGWAGLTPIDIPDLFLAQGSHGIAIQYVAGGPRLTWTRREGEAFGNHDLELEFGGLRTTGFGGTLHEQLVWNGELYYCVGDGLGSVQTIGTGCTNSTGNVAGLGTQNGIPAAIGEQVVFEMANAPANQGLSFVIVGVLDLGGADLGLLGMPGCRLYPDPLVSLAAPTDSNGFGSASITVADNLDTIGFSIYAQGVVADPGHNALGAVVSDALVTIVGCR